jgi:hypothetical protein
MDPRLLSISCVMDAINMMSSGCGGRVTVVAQHISHLLRKESEIGGIGALAPTLEVTKAGRLINDYHHVEATAVIEHKLELSLITNEDYMPPSPF